MNDLKLLLGSSHCISKEHDISVYQPTVIDISNMGEDEFNKLVLPFTLTIDALFGGADIDEETLENLHIFDLFFTDESDGKGCLDGFIGGSALDTIVNGFKFFLKTENIQVLKMRCKLIVDDSYLIDKHEFDILREIIKSVSCREDIKIEKPPKNMNQRQKDIWLKLQKGRQRKSVKDAIYTCDIVNYVMYAGSSFLPMSEIKNMTYYQLTNAYKSILGLDQYKTGMNYKLSQKFDVKEDIKHWTESLKIRK